MCFAAVDYEKVGMPQKADAALDAPKRILGVDSCIDCYRSRGDVLDLRNSSLPWRLTVLELRTQSRSAVGSASSAPAIRRRAYAASQPVQLP